MLKNGIIDYVCITKIGTAQVSDTYMRDNLCHHQNTKIEPKNHKNGQKIIHFSNTVPLFYEYRMHGF